MYYDIMDAKTGQNNALCIPLGRNIPRRGN